MTSALAPAVTLRPLTPSGDDRDALRAWRNDLDARRASPTDRAITEREHLRWWQARWNAAPPYSPPEDVWIIQADGADVGYVRLDPDPDDDRTARVSLVLAPEARGRRIGPRALLLAVPRFVYAHPDTAVEARIRPSRLHPHVGG